ncbi:MAG: PIG-L family deacetylase [Pseudomonadota bacterium]
MPTPDQTRLIKDRARPLIVELWWALRPLASVIRFMQSGAHPDDEMSGMLAALAFRDGINLSYACSTRGEGGQNDIGREAGADLGALRTREMERACDVLGMRMYWHSESPDDPINDFGFSKSGRETITRWGPRRILERFVEIVRMERPDILCPTFLDVPGQHGHHRAMTLAAHQVMQAAADPDFPSNRPPWQIKKLYLPAMSGAGQSYDDAEPPPPATLVIDGSGGDPVSGWSWRRIGEQSRGYHRSQGMGRWVPPGDGADWSLHLAESHVPGPDETLGAGLSGHVGDLAQLPDAGPIAEDLRAAQDAIEAALAAFPDRPRIASAVTEALGAVRRARAGCPEEARSEVVHRLAAKEIQLARALRLALGIEARCAAGQVFLRPGDRTTLDVELGPGAADQAEATLVLPPGWDLDGSGLAIAETAAPSDPYRPFYDPFRPSAPALGIAFTTGEVTAEVRIPFETEPIVLPPSSVELSPAAGVVNLQTDDRHVDFDVDGLWPEDATVSVKVPSGWRAEVGQRAGRISVPNIAQHGVARLPVWVGGAPAETVLEIDHAHIAPTARARRAEMRVLVCDIGVPKGRVGYLGAGNDQVDYWLRAMGANVSSLSDAELASDEALAACKTLVIGIFAMRFRPGLAQAMPRIHRWVAAGGTLVTLYHRPWDNWDPDTIPPRRLEIGQPSLRWRVTDAKAEVRHVGDHPLLSTPNVIGAKDWDGWVKERGLYFAKSWDSAYTPLIEMADPGEPPHWGALLAADIGDGRHVHTSLILHHQMEHLVPGAFRLMANLIAPRQ